MRIKYILLLLMEEFRKHQLRLVIYPTIHKVLYRWCRISSINSSTIYQYSMVALTQLLGGVSVYKTYELITCRS